MKSNNFTFPVLLDPEWNVSRKVYKIPGTPTIFFIDGGGIVRDKKVGESTKEEMLTKITTIMGR